MSPRPSRRLLTAARVLAGLTQNELASAAGVAPSVLQGIEQGRSDPRLSTVLALIDALRRYGVALVPESDSVAWGAVVLRGSRTEKEGLQELELSFEKQANRTKENLTDIAAPKSVPKRLGRRPRS